MVAFTGHRLGASLTSFLWSIWFWILVGRWAIVSFTLRARSLALVSLSILFASVVWPMNALLTCSSAQSVLPWLQSLLFSFTPACPSLVCCHVLFGFSWEELRSVPRIFVYLLNVCKLSVWHANNYFRFHDIHPGALEVIAKVHAQVRFPLPIFFHYFSSSRRWRVFHHQWGASCITGRIGNDVLSLSDF